MKRGILGAALTLLAVTTVSSQITDSAIERVPNLLGGAAGDVLCAETAVSVATTGTAEEVLASCTFPTDVFARYFGFRATMVVDGAANVNSKTVRFRHGGLAGTLMSQETSSVSAQRFVIDVECFVASGTTSLRCTFERGILGGKPGFVSEHTITNPLVLVATGETGTSAGDLTLRSFTVKLYRHHLAGSSAVAANGVITPNRVIIPNGFDQDVPAIASDTVDDSGISFNLNNTHIIVDGDGSSGGPFNYYFGNDSFRSGTMLSLTDPAITVASAVSLRRMAAREVRVGGSFSTETGYIYYGQPIESISGTKTPAAANNSESGECYTNSGADTLQLPDNPPIGTFYCAVVVTASEFTILPGAGETLNEDSDACAVDLTSSTIGSTTWITAMTGGAGAIWVATDSPGWSCNDI